MCIAGFPKGDFTAQVLLIITNKELSIFQNTNKVYFSNNFPYNQKVKKW